MDKLEQVAEALHEGWREYQLRRGRIYGPNRTAGTHPHLVDWAGLDTESRNQDRFIAALLLRLWADRVLAATLLPAAIHDAWVTWERVNSNAHPHAKPFAQAHGGGPEEHELQAQRVLAILGAAAPT